MSDLIERLRNGMEGWSYDVRLVPAEDAEEAADELTALRSQVSELRAGLEVACGALEITADVLRSLHTVSPGHKDNAKRVGTALDHARATLNTIRKDG